MKKLLLIPILLFVVFTQTFAQDCKWDVNKKDPISDTKYIKSDLSKFVKGEKISPDVQPGLKSYIELKDSKVSISVIFEVTPLITLEKVLNPVLTIKLADGNKIEIASDEQFALTLSTASKITTTTSVGRYSSANLKWMISSDDVKKTGASKIAAIRISFAGQDYSFIPEDKPANNY